MAEDILGSNSNSLPQNSKQDPAGNQIQNGMTNRQHYAADPEAQEMVIESLRNQIQDLFSQVTQLNSKLVKSYDRVSDLEDDLHVASNQLRSSTVKISQLELERTQHLAALNTGLLVEKDHVTTELNRLMEKATEEAAQRGQAESARAAIEKELDDLSASLFNQANNMVAEARFAQHISQRKAEEAGEALRGAEEAVSAMQQQVQTLQEGKETAERKTMEMQSLMGKGKWIEKRNSQPLAPSLRLFSSQLPYQEFLHFISHLRQLHLGSQNPPVMSTLLPLPFLTRLSTEDSEPTVRLDLAPSLNWLSRRSVLAAIHTGQLIVEPMSFTKLLMESSHLSNAGISGSGNNEYIPCALCGCWVFPQVQSTDTSPTRTPTHPLMGMAHSYSGSGSSWSTTLFKKSSVSLNSTTNSLPPLQNHNSQTSSNLIYPSQVYIFRIASTQTSSLPQPPLLKSSLSTSGSSTPSSHQHPPALPHAAPGSGMPAQSSSTIYPLCTNGWCLSRLRTTCSMWAFVRTNVVERIWKEELPVVLPPPMPNRPTSSTPASNNSGTNGLDAAEKPPVPPRKRGLWGLASAIGERAASWSESSAEKAKRNATTPTSVKKSKILPHPDSEQEISVAPSEPSAAPPPLPRRSEGRTRTPVPPSSTPSFNSPSPVTNEPLEPSVANPPTDSTPASLAAESSTPSSEQSLTKSSSRALESAIQNGEPRNFTSPPASEPVSVPAAALSTPPQTPTQLQHPVSTAVPTPPPVPLRAAKRLSALQARPCTPSNIPLPESRPVTPPVANSGAPNPPSRTSSPFLGTPTITSGAPPPIPRRAAARTPRRAVGESGDNSRPNSPAIPPSPAKAGEVQAESQTVTQPQSQLNSVVEIVEENKGKKERSEEPNAQTKLPDVPNAIEHASSMQSTISTFSETDVFMDAEDEIQEEGEKAEADDVQTIKEGKETKETEEQEKGREIALEAKRGSLDLPGNEPPAISLNDQSLPLVPTSADVPPPVAPSYSEPGQDLKQGVGNVDGSETQGAEDVENKERNYVGESTWEEKTWKELARLREEMFLARIGAVRSQVLEHWGAQY